jgi:hypothetical protein
MNQDEPQQLLERMQRIEKDIAELNANVIKLMHHLVPKKPSNPETFFDKGPKPKSFKQH